MGTRRPLANPLPPRVFWYSRPPSGARRALKWREGSNDGGGDGRPHEDRRVRLYDGLVRSSATK